MLVLNGSKDMQLARMFALAELPYLTFVCSRRARGLQAEYLDGSRVSSSKTDAT
jgi:hypothetical protein